MFEVLSRALGALPGIATSVPALVAYALTIVAYVLVVYRVVRNRNLLEHLKKLPEKDRAATLQIEMQGGYLAKGLSPEDWLKLQARRYILVCALLIIVLGSFIISLAIVHAWGTVDVDVGVVSGSRAPPAHLSSSPIATADAREASWDPNISKKASNDWEVTYEYTKLSNQLIVRPVSGYLQKLTSGERVSGLISAGRDGTFTWNFPRLAVKIANNTGKVVILSKVHFVVKEAKRDLSPVLVAQGASTYGELRLYNEGWGPALGAQLNAAVSDNENCKTGSYAQPITIALGDIQEGLEYNLISAFTQTHGHIGGGIFGHIPIPAHPDSYKAIANINSANQTGTPGACVRGDLKYRDTYGKNETFKFVTVIFFRQSPPLGPIPASCEYDMFIDSRRSSSDVWKDISQEVKPGDVDQFIIRVATDQSADFLMRISILSADGSSVWDGDVKLSVFVPRSSGPTQGHPVPCFAS